MWLTIVHPSNMQTMQRKAGRQPRPQREIERTVVDIPVLVEIDGNPSIDYTQMTIQEVVNTTEDELTLVVLGRTEEEKSLFILPSFE